MNQILANHEKALDLNAAFQRALGIRPDLQAIRRWYTKGTNGQRLEVVRVGGRVYTSVEAVQRFVEAQSMPTCEVKEPAKRGRPKKIDNKPALRRHYPEFGT